MSAKEQELCCVCDNLLLNGKTVVSNPGLVLIKDLLQKAQERVSLGENTYEYIVKKLSGLSDDELRIVRYHRDCRGTVNSKTAIARLGKRYNAIDSGDETIHVPPVKRGRPSTSSCEPKRSTRQKVCPPPKEVKCVFAPTFCKWDDDTLHRVFTDGRGQELINIKDATTNDIVRACLSDLFEKEDASAKEKWYHSNCIRDAARTCPKSADAERAKRLELCDIQLIMYVESMVNSLETEERLYMSEVNAKYNQILHDANVDDIPNKQGKYLKCLIKKSLPNLQFIQPPRMYESEYIMLPENLSKSLDMYQENVTSAAGQLASVSRLLRKELLSHRGKWKFNGNFNDYETPPMMFMFLSQLLFGKHESDIAQPRRAHVQKIIDTAGQVLLHNTMSDRQVKHTPKKDAGFVHETQTPLSIGLPLTIHQKARDKVLVNLLSDVYLGSGYKTILNIEKRVECAVVHRMSETGGFCLPDFIKHEKSVFFAIDNIDFLEDTPFGQNTTHGTLIVIWQEDDDQAESINRPLEIPEKITPHRLEITYREDPIINLKPIRFEKFEFSEQSDLLISLERSDHVWALASHLSNIIPTLNEINQVEGQAQGPQEGNIQSLQNNGTGEMPVTQYNNAVESQLPTNSVVDEIQPDIDDNATELQSQMDSDITVAQLQMNNDNDVEMHDVHNTAQNDVVQDPKSSSSSILKISADVPRKPKHKATDVMPTWAATNSLLLSECTPQNKTNTEVIAPLFKTSPTDYGTLYTVLMLTQEISAYVVGPDRRTIITLDMDLYERAMKIQGSVQNKNWILRPGELHYSFAALHALGKYMEGSGVDSCSVETGIYSPAALRKIYSGKSFKRGIEYHITNMLACLMLKFEAVLADFPGPLKQQCQNLKEALHNREEESVELFMDIKSFYAENIEHNMKIAKDASEMAAFLDNYIMQVEVLLHIVSTCRKGDWEGYLAAAEAQVKYLFAHDLFHYARLIPVHIAQMKKLKMEDEPTWEALKEGGFCVRKGNTPFTNLFSDQNLEQHIKELKGIGGLLGLTQCPEALDRLFLIMPQIAKLVKQFKASFPMCSVQNNEEHYQLKGDIALRCGKNALKLHDSIITHCLGNPYKSDTPLKSLVSSLIVPAKAKEDIILRDSKGQAAFQTFVKERLLPDSPKSVWDPMKKLKIKTFSTWMNKSKVRVGDKVIKLREERALLARFLVIQQSRGELLPKLGNTIGQYEMAVIPRALFAIDGSLLIPTDKASIMHAIEEAKIPYNPESNGDTDSNELANDALDMPTAIDVQELILDAPAVSEHHNEHNDILLDELANLDAEDIINVKVIIIDAMAVVQCLKKTVATKTIADLTSQFVKRIQRMMKGYSEGRIIFDKYVEHSLKDKTRAKRATSAAAAVLEYEIHDGMALARISLKELLSSSKTKSQITKHFALALLDAFVGSEQQIVVVEGTSAKSNEPFEVSEDISVHEHEEADTLIPLHVLDTLKEGSERHIDVWSPDTDVLLLLMDLVGNDRLGASTKLHFITGKGKNHRSIDVIDRVNAIGQMKARGLIGLHHFSGADWGGKWVGISKKTWINAYLALPNDDPAIQAFIHLGSLNSAELLYNEDQLPHHAQSLEKFVCSVYDKKGPQDLPSLRWQLFRTRSLEGEKLPPSRATFMPHLMRANFTAMRDKAYTTAKPVLPPLENNGWKVDDGNISPILCLQLPAPAAVLELVKCGCKKRACAHLCSCAKNNLVCTALCKCFASGCTNFKDYSITEEDEENDDVL